MAAQDMTAAASPEDPTKKPEPLIHISTVNIHYKRTKEEAAIIANEMERLHKYIDTGNELDWAKNRVERIQELILSPDATAIRKQIQGTVKED